MHSTSHLPLPRIEWTTRAGAQALCLCTHPSLANGLMWSVHDADLPVLLISPRGSLVKPDFVVRLSPAAQHSLATMSEAAACAGAPVTASPALSLSGLSDAVCATPVLAAQCRVASWPSRAWHAYVVRSPSV
ncbi:hypothetical protein EON66_10000 [archaeon]|nr:MAG: hypothetical protein EON66_10000 [archaeon]